LEAYSHDEMSSEVDIKENLIWELDRQVLELLLVDRSRSKRDNGHSHIIWATDNYASLGNGFQEHDEIAVESITGKNGEVLRPRTAKSKEEQDARIREKAEVFTPSWVCNRQNNLIDKAWFGKDGVFNTDEEGSWSTNSKKIRFGTRAGKRWEDYVKDIRLEICCGEGPYLVSRYDAITGEPISVGERIGILDRKLRVVSENTESEEEWDRWALEALKSVYGFDWQGDNVIITRENLLFTVIDFRHDKFGDKPDKELLRKFADIISWNIWQMDGLKGVIPDSCHDDEQVEVSLFGEETSTVTKCPGCEKDMITKHNGTYCLIMDWEKGKTVRYIDLIKK